MYVWLLCCSSVFFYIKSCTNDVSKLLHFTFSVDTLAIYHSSLLFNLFFCHDECLGHYIISIYFCKSGGGCRGTYFVSVMCYSIFMLYNIFEAQALLFLWIFLS